ncbi:3-isopropylmalate dehydrogenase [Desulfurobacterium thermolithotrophum DSM 11699]|uniref:3-isopropylmalate dehydrogenase n=1 Tax=Desulfurobacterium thermolithotrophum (strain DSM 11699 / BSA) TaxID=868864 RepID=F0S0D0_DESTD|nr:3-isopropylmalate dehydrogenase [Desulfurobacterium thermolithotrophum]ADY73809.1 3-isopropylmalate dehydrogenase [Desulfurobacterium thermolithotrophum DSM 11699]
MKTFKIAVLPGDGIGPEIVKQAVKVMDAVSEKFNVKLEYNYGLIGGAAIDECGIPFPEETKEIILSSDAVLLGAVGGPKWDNLDFSIRPERALLGMRKLLNAFANLRPAKLYDELIDASTLRPEVVRGVDIMVVRELTSGIYFGIPRGIFEDDGEKVGINTLRYREHEVERIARVAFEVARKRNKKVTSVDKANVLEATVLWREVIEEVHKEYEDVELNHMYVDNAAMQIIRWPKQFDVIVTTNIFGDILSDACAMLTGSLGMLPSASIGGKIGLYEPIHGSAPDIAGQNIANPIATINSIGMMFTYSFDMPEVEKAIDEAVKGVLAKGYRTKDICSEGTKLVSTEEMGDLIAEEIKKL